MYKPAPEMTPDFLITRTKNAKEWLSNSPFGKTGGEGVNTRPVAVASLRCRYCLCQGPRLAGQAVTIQPCMSCHSEEVYSSTATDVLCHSCASKNELCKKCGADILLREDRTDWPAPLPDA